MVASRPATPPATNRPLVDHLVARDGVPAPVGLAYDYVLAGDGLWLAAANDALAVRVPVAPCMVRGLPPLGARCHLRHGPIPGRIWDACVGIATAVAEVGAEALLLVIADGEGRYALHIPPQAVSATRVRYTTLAVPHDTTVALHLHSHHGLPAYFSATDDRDEQGLALYGVLGRLGTERPEVALRAGAYGHWQSLRWAEVFGGDQKAFRDTYADPPNDLSGAESEDDSDALTVEGSFEGGDEPWAT